MPTASYMSTWFVAPRRKPGCLLTTGDLQLTTATAATAATAAAATAAATAASSTVRWVGVHPSQLPIRVRFQCCWYCVRLPTDMSRRPDSYRSFLWSKANGWRVPRR